MVMLWGYLGPSSLAGLALLILIMILNVFLVSKMKHLQVSRQSPVHTPKYM